MSKKNNQTKVSVKVSDVENTLSFNLKKFHDNLTYFGMSPNHLTIRKIKEDLKVK